MDGFAVLTEPTRRRILDQLRTAESQAAGGRTGTDVGSLVSALALPQPTISKHLKVLREAGAVTVRVDGPRRVYQLADRPLSDVTAWLEPYRQMWADSLNALEHHLEHFDDREDPDDQPAA